MKRRKLEDFITVNLDGAYRFAYTYMKNKEDAEDVVSESVIKALKAFKKIRNEDTLKSWFYKIVANTALTELKKKGRMVALDTDDVMRIASVDDYSALNFESMVKNVDEKTKAILVLKCCEDMTFGEISEILDMNENTVKTRFYAATKKLREEI